MARLLKHELGGLEIHKAGHRVREMLVSSAEALRASVDVTDARLNEPISAFDLSVGVREKW